MVWWVFETVCVKDIYIYQEYFNGDMQLVLENFVWSFCFYDLVDHVLLDYWNLVFEIYLGIWVNGNYYYKSLEIISVGAFLKSVMRFMGLAMMMTYQMR